MSMTISGGIEPSPLTASAPVQTCAPQSQSSAPLLIESGDKADLTKPTKEEKPGWLERVRKRLDECFPPSTTGSEASKQGYMERFLNKVLGKTEKDGKPVPRYLEWQETIWKFFNGNVPRIKPRA